MKPTIISGSLMSLLMRQNETRMIDPETCEYFGEEYRSPLLKKAVICDVDGTLAKMNGRTPFEWDRVDSDLPIESVINLVNIFHGHGHEVVIMSGRSDKCYNKTLDWLLNNLTLKHGVPFNLFMRKDGDYRKDSEVKKELYQEFVEPKWDVAYVIDDRNQVVKMWRELGLTVLQVADGDF